MEKEYNKQIVAGLLGSAMMGSRKKTSIISGANSVSNQAIREYLVHIWRQYKNASKSQKTRLLDEVCRNLGLHRKAVIRLLRKKYKPRSYQGYIGGRKKKYSPTAKKHLESLWQLMGYICAEKMKVALPEWLEYYEHNECDEQIRSELTRMSISSIKRFLAPAKSRLRRKMNSGTRRLKKFITKIPIRDFKQKFTEPGHCEIDCVAHCGGSLSGEFVWTLTVTDIFSGWTECAAMWGKTGYSVKVALEQIEKRLPFKLKALYVDNGSEFINSTIVDNYVAKHISGSLKIFRSRAYHKNDQCYVEQKNYTHVRHLFGYGRVDWKNMARLMNTIYRNQWSTLQNYFIPQQKLIKKIRIGSKVVRKMSKPQTPYSRIKPFLNHLELLQIKTIRKHANQIRLRKNQLANVRQLNRYLSINKNDRGRMAI